MITLLTIVALGFFLGMRHAADPDHVIAVTTIVARHRSLRDAGLIGAFWGVGHTVTLLVVGGAIIFFRWAIPPWLGLFLEFSVGLMLIVLGILNISGFLQSINEKFTPAHPLKTDTHSRSHSHGDFIHTYPHGPDPDAHPHNPGHTPLNRLDRHFGRIGLYQIIRPLIVGIVHGLAGSAAVALLVLTTIDDPRWAVGYLLVFGVGTIAGMMLITGAIAMPFAYSGRRFSQLNRAFRIASGVISVGFGLFIAYRIGIVDGLFTSHPYWIPQ